MRQEIHFEKQNEVVDTPPEGTMVWVDYHPYHNSMDTMPLPVACLRVYEDGSWDGVLEEADA